MDDIVAHEGRGNQNGCPPDTPLPPLVFAEFNPRLFSDFYNQPFNHIGGQKASVPQFCWDGVIGIGETQSGFKCFGVIPNVPKQTVKVKGEFWLPANYRLADALCLEALWELLGKPVTNLLQLLFQPFNLRLQLQCFA